MSEHEINIVEVGEIYAHPNADALELTTVNGWQVVVRKGDFNKGDKAVYIEPDYIVSVDRKEFAFLRDPAKFDQTHHRLKAIKLRGELSYGLLIHVPAELSNSDIGENVIDELGITRYEPPEPGATDTAALHGKWPAHAPVFDVESLKKRDKLFDPEEEVIATEKIHGTNARFTSTSVNITGENYHDVDVIPGSRKRWLNEEGSGCWGVILKKYPQIKELVKTHGLSLYGEIYGPVQSLKYGLNEHAFAAFALVTFDGRYLDHDIMMKFLKAYDIPAAPVVYRGPYKNLDLAIAEQDSVVSKTPQMMEGIVIKPAKERNHPRYGRVIGKHISNRYWLKK